MCNNLQPNLGDIIMTFFALSPRRHFFCYSHKHERVKCLFLPKNLCEVSTNYVVFCCYSLELSIAMFMKNSKISSLHNFLALVINNNMLY